MCGSIQQLLQNVMNKINTALYLYVCMYFMLSSCCKIISIPCVVEIILTRRYLNNKVHKYRDIFCSLRVKKILYIFCCVMLHSHSHMVFVVDQLWYRSDSCPSQLTYSSQSQCTSSINSHASAIGGSQRVKHKERSSLQNHFLR